MGTDKSEITCESLGYSYKRVRAAGFFKNVEKGRQVLKKAIKGLLDAKSNYKRTVWWEHPDKFA